MFARQLNKRALSLLSKSCWSNNTKPWIVMIAKMAVSKQPILCNSKGYVRNFSTDVVTPSGKSLFTNSLKTVNDVMEIVRNIHEKSNEEKLSILTEMILFIKSNKESEIRLTVNGVNNHLKTLVDNTADHDLPANDTLEILFKICDVMELLNNNENKGISQEIIESKTL
jgi:hypothetical protein